VSCAVDGGAGSADAGADSGDVDSGDDDPSDAIDEFWGAAPDTTTRLAVFDEIWEALASGYAAFAVKDVNWDAVGESYRSKVEQAESYGRFFQLLSEMLGEELQDGHTWIFSEKVCFESDLASRPPIFRLNMHSSTLGVCANPLDDGRLVVYRVAPNNPAGLAPGDVILGYDGTPWIELLDLVATWRLPVCGHRAPSDDAESYNLLVNAVNNAHLFEVLDVERYGADAPEAIPTDDLIDYANDTPGDYWRPSAGMLCPDQLPVEGVEAPWTRFEDSYDPLWGGGYATWGLLEGTNIGYIYLYSWGIELFHDFEQAIADLMTTEGLIIDQRFNTGGYAAWENGMSLLFDQDHPQILYHAFRDASSGDYNALDFDDPAGWRSIDADEATYYDRPIAVLQGPHAASAGDIFPYFMTFHPRARLFGAVTHGSFGGLDCYWCDQPDPHLNDLFFAYTNHTDFDADLDYLQGTDQVPQEPIGMSRDDVAAGIDTVVESAREWIVLSQ
jgi:hypothetical protein